MSRTKAKSERDEESTDLLFWFGDGACGRYKARVPADTRLSIGRADSNRALGFVVSRGKARIDFVLDKDQVVELAAYLQIIHHGLLKPIGRKPHQMSLVPILKGMRAKRR